ncbi:MAG: hypothetical protein ACLUYV_05690 [Alistipes shahii]
MPEPNSVTSSPSWDGRSTKSSSQAPIPISGPNTSPPRQPFFTRAVLQPRLDVRTGQCGTTAPKSAHAQPAGDTARRHPRRALLAQARTLLHRAAEHLRAHRDEFPEYDPENDIFNRCTTDGGFVQIR